MIPRFPFRLLLFFFFSVSINSSELLAQSLGVELGATKSRDDSIARTISGEWTYRSFHSVPTFDDDPLPIEQLMFGRGTLDLTVSEPNRIAGTLGGPGWELTIKGIVTQSNPVQIEFQGRGKINGEEWIYDYIGYVIPEWKNGIEQRPAIVGSIVRTVKHGENPAGYVAQWIAVRQDAETETTVTNAQSPKKAGERKVANRLLGMQGMAKTGMPKQDMKKVLKSYYDAAKQSNQRLRGLKELGIEDSLPKLRRRSLAMAVNSTSELEQPDEIDAADGHFDLDVDFAINKIGDQTVELRSYNGKLVGPTIRVKAGDSILLRVNNNLPEEPDDGDHVNGHHAWNVTNLHTHGLHVAPQGTPELESDNVLIRINPGESQEYKIVVPENHVGGTFWYHAHKHGAVASQVSSGMAGALIIERETGSLDDVEEIKGAKERILVLQQVPYIVGDDNVGRIELGNEGPMFGPGRWHNSDLYTTVNGQEVPVIKMKPGEVQRWRIVHTGVREAIRLQIQKVVNGQTTSERVNFHEVAVDGLPLGHVDTKPEIELWPGYRSDAMVKAPSEEGTFVLVDETSPASGSLSGVSEPLNYIAKVVVQGASVSMELPTNQAVEKYRLPTVKDSELTGTQEAFYGITGQGFVIGKNPGNPSLPVSDGKPYSKTNIRPLKLGDVQEWVVGTRNGALGGQQPIGAPHPFHIHVNPFEVIEVNGQALEKPVWRDTLVMRQGSTIKFRTRYEDFTGDFVQHCHVLDHEDQGMMELVRIEANVSAPLNNNQISDSIPDSNGKPSVLFFVKGATCVHCMSQLTEMASALSGKDLDVSVVSAADENDLKAFPRVPFNLVSDPERKLFESFGAIRNGELMHATFVRDSLGNTMFSDINDEPLMDQSVILAALTEGVLAEPKIVVAVRKTESATDDYVTWAPCECEIFVEDGDGSLDDIEVFLTNTWSEDEPPGGLAFAKTLAAGKTATEDSITLTLKQNGTRETFFIAGVKPSQLTEASLANGGRDAELEVRLEDAAGELLSTTPLMVRVRRNASGLNDLEKTEFMKSVAGVKASGFYKQLVDAHTIATGRTPGDDWPDQAHGGPGFLPWHRAFLLIYERKLQETHPHVALHFWREDEQSHVFEKEFFGSTSTSGGLENVNFGIPDAMNPLFGWEFNGTILQRTARDRTNLSNFNNQSFVISPTSYEEFSERLEGNPHNFGHGWVGGPMRSCQTSPRDPVFYLFHCDVDRLWARWQYEHGRFGTDGSDPDDYDPNDEFVAGATSIPFGHHLKDTMWPWDGVTGPGNPSDDLDDRPGTAPLSPFPASGINGIWPKDSASPTPAEMIDYLRSGGGSNDLGFCYEEIPFGTSGDDVELDVIDVAAAVERVVNPDAPFALRRRSAMRLTGRLQETDIDKLIAIVKDDKQADSIRQSTLRALSVQSNDKWIAPAIEVAKADKVSSEELRTFAIERLATSAMFTDQGRSKKKEIHSTLNGLVNSDQTMPVRLAALEALSTAMNPEAIEMLRKTVGDDDGLIPQTQAISLLATAQPGKNFDVLRPLIKSGIPNEVRVQAMLSIGADYESLKERRTIMQSNDEPVAVRVAAAKSLMHRDPEFVDAALEIIGDAKANSALKSLLATGIHVHAVNRLQNRCNPATIVEKLNAFEASDETMSVRLKDVSKRIASLIKK